MCATRREQRHTGDSSSATRGRRIGLGSSFIRSATANAIVVATSTASASAVGATRRTAALPRAGLLRRSSTGGGRRPRGRGEEGDDAPERHVLEERVVEQGVHEDRDEDARERYAHRRSRVPER